LISKFTVKSIYSLGSAEFNYRYSIGTRRNLSDPNISFVFWLSDPTISDCRNPSDPKSDNFRSDSDTRIPTTSDRFPIGNCRNPRRKASDIMGNPIGSDKIRPQDSSSWVIHWILNNFKMLDFPIYRNSIWFSKKIHFLKIGKSITYFTRFEKSYTYLQKIK